MKAIRNIIKKFTENTKTNKNMLTGRWSNTHSDNQKNLNAFYTNYDNCGDIICGEKPTNSKLYRNMSVVEKKNN